MKTAERVPEAVAKKWVASMIKGGRLAELREANGLSQGDIARHLGVNQSTVWRWEAGEYRPRGKHAVALRELLGVDG